MMLTVHMYDAAGADKATVHVACLMELNFCKGQ